VKIYISFFLFYCISSLLYSQSNITNTLGNGGVFSIKDANTNYLTLTQSTGEVSIFKGLRLQLTGNSSTVGVIFKGDDRFIHDFTPVGVNSRNMFIGINSGNFTMTHSTGADASANTGVGQWTLFSLTTGYDNTALGFASLYSNTSGTYNTGSGFYSLFSNTSGSFNTAVGSHSLEANTTGSDNTALGYSSLYSNTTGRENTASGFNSLVNNTTGNYNTAFGMNSLFINTAGFQNTAVGHHSLQNNNGNYNTALGYNAGSTVTTGANLTLIGIDANPSTPTALNQITLGNTFVTSLRCNVQTITSLSDARDKKNITDLNLGIDFLMKIKPRVFNWDKREWYIDNMSDGSKIKEEPTAGFIAQELDEVQTTENAEWLNLVLKDNPEKLEATPGNLLPIIVKAIQDLKKENDELKAANAELTSKLNKFVQMQNTLAAEVEKLKASNNETTKVSLGEQ
jgi:hypothetical protein